MSILYKYNKHLLLVISIINFKGDSLSIRKGSIKLKMINFSVFEFLILVNVIISSSIVIMNDAYFTYIIDLRNSRMVGWIMSILRTSFK